MPALTENRNTPEAIGRIRNGRVAAAATIFAGAMVMRNAAGDLLPGATATGLIGVGRAEVYVDNATGAAGDKMADVVAGTFRYANSAGADEITGADIGQLVYAVDDQTVARTDGTASRSPAGHVEMIDDQGVWVRFDEITTRIAAV